jgi:uncharacterized protein YneF (UPF0154 family)
MSGAEAADPGFVWSFSIGNIATLISIVTSVIGGAFLFIKYIKKDVRDAILTSSDKIDNLKDQVVSEKESTKAELIRNVERINEIKWMMQEIGKRVDETKADANKRVDERVEDIKEMNKKLDQLRNEQYELKLAIVQKIETSQKLGVDARLRMSEIYDTAKTRGDEAMENIKKRMASQEYKEEEAREKARGVATTLREKEGRQRRREEEERGYADDGTWDEGEEEQDPQE